MAKKSHRVLLTVVLLIAFVGSTASYAIAEQPSHQHTYPPQQPSIDDVNTNDSSARKICSEAHC